MIRLIDLNDANADYAKPGGWNGMIFFIYLLNIFFYKTQNKPSLY